MANRERTPIPLKRSIFRGVILPALLVAAGAAGSVTALVALERPLAIIVAGAGGALALLGAVLGLYLASIRVEVVPGSLRLASLTGRRDYRLVPGAVTRLALPPTGRSPIRARFQLFGLAYGRGRLRADEPVSVVKLGRVASVIVVPTERGRVVIAPRDEAQLLAALSSAARPERVSTAVPIAPAPTPGRPLTGIERARLEAERAAALAADEEARRAELQRAQAEQEAAEAARRAELERIQREQDEAEAQRRAAMERVEAERHAERERAAAAERAAEEQRLAAERLAEEQRRAAERAVEEERRLAAERAAAEERRLLDERAAAEQRRLAIERAEQEQRRVAAQRAADDERARASQRAAEGASEQPPPPPVLQPHLPGGQQQQQRRPFFGRRAATPGGGFPQPVPIALTQPAQPAPPAPAETFAPQGTPGGGGTAAVATLPAERRRVDPAAAAAALVVSLSPSIVAGAVAGAFLLPGVAILRPATRPEDLAIGLLLAGPLSTVGSLLARYGWPRLAGLVAAAGLFTIVLLVRAALG